MSTYFKTGIIPSKKVKNEDFKTEIDNLEYKKFIIDVSRLPKPIQDLNFQDYNSEMCLQHQVVVGHIPDTANARVKAAFTIPADRFSLDNLYSFDTLKASIKKIYQELYLYKHITLIEQYLNTNIQQMKNCIDNSVFKDIKYGDAMLLAITFYLGIKQEDEGKVLRGSSEMTRFRFQDLNQNDDPKNDLIEAMLASKKETEEVCWWINRGISFIQPYIGECTRVIDISSESMISYYQAGKVFNWIQFSSANQGKIISDWTKDRNVIFHIYSQTGRNVSQFQAEQNFQDESTILFSPGCEFLVCKAQQIDDKHHIWIREIHTGFGSNVVLWIDDNLFPQIENVKNIENENQKYLHKIYSKAFDKNINFILKASSQVAWAYINSQLFLNSLKHCNSFKIVSDMVRFNESQEKEDCYVAGAKFIYQFRQQTQNWENVQKIQYMIFCKNKEKANQSLAQFEIEEGSEFSPQITVNSKEFLMFLDQ